MPYPVSATIGSDGGRVKVTGEVEVIFPAGFFREDATVTLLEPVAVPSAYRNVFASESAFPLTISGGDPDYSKDFDVFLWFDSAFNPVRSKLRVCGTSKVGDWDPGVWSPAPTHIDQSVNYELGGSGFTRPLRFAVIKKIP